MRQYKISIDGKEYMGQTASAKAQFEALQIAGKTGFIVALKDDVSDMSITASLLVMPFPEINRIADLLVKDLITIDKVPVAENLFIDNIQNYYLLIAKAVKENVGNFWKLRRPEKPDNQAAEQQ